MDNSILLSIISLIKTALDTQKSLAENGAITQQQLTKLREADNEVHEVAQKLADAIREEKASRKPKS